MQAVFVRLYGPLNDFLPARRRQATLVCTLTSPASVKDVVEALGVPHTEVEYVLVNGQPVAFAQLVRGGDRIAAFPPFLTLQVSALPRLGPPPQEQPAFVADVHLGRLAGYLRLAGFDVAYRNDYRDPELVAISAGEDRTLLTRDVGVLKHRAVRRGYFVRETKPERQLAEVLHRFDLAARTAPFTRCIRCNGRLAPVAKSEVLDLIPPRTREHYDDFRRCTGCGRVYWAGSHHARMRRLLDTAAATPGSPHQNG